MATEIETPDFDFSALYYPQILEALLQFTRTNVPEITDESPQEPLMQVLRAFALTAHLNNTLIDLVANESTLRTARLTETVRNMLQLIDFQLRPATPAQADLVYELSQVTSSTTEAISQFAQAATRATDNEPARFFEALESLSLERTDQLSACFATASGVFADFTAQANDGTAGQDFSPWTTPLGGTGGPLGSEGDALYLGHKQAMWGEIDLAIKTPGLNLTGVWEYFDGNVQKARPDTVTLVTATSLRFVLSGYLGTSDRTGTKVRVRLNASGAFEDLFVQFLAGENVVETVGLLGQSSPSTDANAYTVGSEWEALDDLSDATGNLLAGGKVTFAFPQTITRNWSLGTHNGVSAFWIRYRIISVGGGATSPEIDRIRIDTGKQFLKRNVTQGRFHTESPLGDSNGTPNQRFRGSKPNFISGSDALSVSGTQWTRVENFLASRPTDRHYRIELVDDDQPEFIFGDGASGAIPPVGVGNIVATYRFGADIDGNVGALSIAQDKTGLTLVSKVFNPRPALGWAEAQGATTESLERAKIEGPASFRVKEVALGPDDVTNLVLRASDLDPSVVRITRSKAIEEGFGPKTIELVVVAAGAGLLSPEQIEAVSTFFNGNPFVTPVKRKRILANQEVSAVNYIQKPIDITATVFGSVTEAQVQNRLLQLIQPEALKRDGITFEWTFGGKIPTDRIIHEIFKSDENESITDVNLTVPSADVVLQPRELPVAGAINITVVPPA